MGVFLEHSNTFPKPPKKSLSDLFWCRLTSSHLVPRYLIESFLPMDIDEFYRLFEILVEEGVGFKENIHIWGLVEKYSKTIKGFVWFHVDNMQNNIVITKYSLDKAYQGNTSESFEKLSGLIKFVSKTRNIHRVSILSDKSRVFQKFGFKITKYTTLELNL